MGFLNNVILDQLNAIRANYNSRKAPNSALILVNYMPVLRFLEPYVEITEEEATRLMSEGFPAPVTKKKGKDLTTVPFIPSIPGYAYYCNIPLEIKGKDTAYAVFKRSPRSPEQPVLIQIKDKYYRNPNVVPLNNVIMDAYNTSMISKYLVKEPADWEPVPNGSAFPEMRCYNYTTYQFKDLLFNRVSANNTFRLDSEILKIINTHMFIAQTELGHYFSTYRKRSMGTGTLAYCYNSEFVPIYYGFNLESILNDINHESRPWVDTLIDTVQPTKEMIQKYIAVPECCTHLITKDAKVYREINGIELSNFTTMPVYYMTRQDIFLISKLLTVPAKEGSQDKDTYSYRNIMPFIFSDLFDAAAATGVSVPEYYKPNQWLAKVCIITNSAGHEGKYISFDVKQEPNSQETIKEVYLSYVQYATLMYHNYMDHLDTAYRYQAYIDNTLRTFPMLPVAALDTERKQALLNSYTQFFLNRFFSRMED